VIDVGPIRQNRPHNRAGKLGVTSRPEYDVLPVGQGLKRQPYGQFVRIGEAGGHRPRAKRMNLPDAVGSLERRVRPDEGFIEAHEVYVLCYWQDLRGLPFESV
jgi:hypothetical protein